MRGNDVFRVDLPGGDKVVDLDNDQFRRHSHLRIEVSGCLVIDEIPQGVRLVRLDESHPASYSCLKEVLAQE